MQIFVDARPSIALNIHIDDIGLTATERSDDQVVEKLSESAAAMHSLVEDELECKVSIPKADLVATSDALRLRVGGILQQFGHKKTTTEAINLGIDATGGMRISRASSQKLKARFKKQKQRQQRLQRWARVDRAGATKVFRQGVLPAVEYGTQVWGYSCKEFRDLQSFPSSRHAQRQRTK